MGGQKTVRKAYLWAKESNLKLSKYGSRMPTSTYEIQWLSWQKRFNPSKPSGKYAYHLL
jgi:hypothetical protein